MVMAALVIRQPPKVSLLPPPVHCTHHSWGSPREGDFLEESYTHPRQGGPILKEATGCASALSRKAGLGLYSLLRLEVSVNDAETVQVVQPQS